jgi:hypothetical protein
MLVPDQRKSSHVISMYLATCGANGNLLGSDEKEIIYLVFGIIDLQNKEVSDQFAVARVRLPIKDIPEKHVFSQLWPLRRKKEKSL